MAEHVIHRGLDIPIDGAASGAPVQLDPPATVAYAPQEFRGIIPRLSAKPGDAVRVGSPLFHDKLHTDIVFRSPVAGTVREVRRGRRRVITDVVIDRSGEDAEPLKSFTLSELRGLSGDAMVEAVLATGLWAGLRTRPLNRVANPTVRPQSILIGAHETGPLQPGADVLLDADAADALQAAVVALKAMTDGPVYIAEGAGAGHPALAMLDGVERHGFSGPHPAGDPSVQINLVDPPRGTNTVWYIRAWDAADLGRALLSGRFPAERVYAAVGTAVKTPRLVRTILGAPIADIVGPTVDGEVRWIRGSVLTGEAVDPGRWAGFYSRGVQVIPDVVHRDLWGWGLPALGKWSFHRAFLSGFSRPSRRYDLRPGLFGGERAIVPLNIYRKVVATPDIHPEFLFKAMISGDLEEAIQLGMLDLSDEEAALCTFICPSKIEFDLILRDGIELYEQEA